MKGRGPSSRCRQQRDPRMYDTSIIITRERVNHDSRKLLCCMSAYVDNDWGRRCPTMPQPSTAQIFLLLKMFQKTLIALLAVGAAAFVPTNPAFVARRQGALFAATDDKVKAIIVEQLGVDAEKVVGSATFIDDLGADSLDTVELIMAIEEEFDCEIPEEEAANISTVQEVMDFVAKL